MWFGWESCDFIDVVFIGFLNFDIVLGVGGLLKVSFLMFF